MRQSLIIASMLALLLPGAAFAQSLGSTITSTNPLSVSVSPTYPAPYSQASVSVTSTSVDLTAATLTITSKGKQLYKGNVQTVPVTLGGSGSVTTLAVTVTTAASTYTQTVTIQPEDVSLIAEPQGTVPPLYPGKSLVPLGGSVRVVAIANLQDAAGKTLDPANLAYTWTVDGARITAGSGIGKTSLLVASPLQYRTRSVSVVVQSQSGSLVGGATISLSPSTPTVRIYENDPLLGVRFDKALLSTYSLGSAEASLYAAPFSLPTDSTPSIQWFLNSAAAQQGPILTLRPTGSGQGTASLSVTASSGSLANAVANLSLSFGNTASTNVFGL